MCTADDLENVIVFAAGTIYIFPLHLGKKRWCTRNCWSCLGSTHHYAARLASHATAGHPPSHLKLQGQAPQPLPITPSPVHKCLSWYILQPLRTMLISSYVWGTFNHLAIAGLASNVCIWTTDPIIVWSLEDSLVSVCLHPGLFIYLQQLVLVATKQLNDTCLHLCSCTGDPKQHCPLQHTYSYI